MTTVGKHRWGAGQSSSDAFVRDLVENNQQAESGGRVLDLGDLVSPDSVLRRLSVELFDFVFPAIDTWGVVRGLMATERGSWSSVHSEDLPEGLSDRGEDSHSTEDTPSVSGSSRAVGPDDSWIARSYLSKVVDVEGLDKLRSRYQIPEDVVLRIPQSDEVACSSRFGDVAFYEADFNAGVRFPMQPLMRELLDRLNLAPGQLAPNAWRTVVGSMVMWKLIVGTPSSNREWKDNYVFVCGDNWEGLQCEKDDNFIPVRREWGVPSSSALRRPKLDENGHNRGWRPLSSTVEKLKKMMMTQQEEAPLVIGKKRKADASSKKVTDERNLPPPPPAPEAVCPRACSHLVGPDRAYSDSQPLHAVGGGSVGSRRFGCLRLPRPIRRLTSLVNELTLDRDRVVGELSSAKADLTRKDEDLRRALDDVNRADEQVKKLTSQLEVAVEDFKSSEAYDDNNTKYFLSGFSFLKKQAKEKYPELDFEAFQPFDDDESVMPVGDDNAGPSTDPQMDDDATS
uniref:Uncharacterized protein n=1 Tax=Fagus sylvatica TaxID=28930 RepID=A0A2N9ESR4_FAGSY